MPLRLHALPISLRPFSALFLVLLFLVSCSSKKGEDPGESSALRQPVAEDRKTNLSNGASNGGLSGGEGDAEVGSEGVGGLQDDDKDEGKADEDDAAFRMIVD